MRWSIILLVLLSENVDMAHGECSTLPTFEHAFVSEEYKKAEYRKGDVIYFSCEPGYSTGLNTTYVCTEQGWRAATFGQCFESNDPVPLGCTPPPPIQNGYLSERSFYFYANGKRVGYQCNDTYKLTGQRYKTCNNGQWTGDVQCHMITCKLSAERPLGTTYDPNNQIIFKPGQSVRVSCGEKDWVKSPDLQSVELRCQNTGRWDYEPVCQPVTCSKHAEKVYIWQRTWGNTVLMDVTLGYGCYTGYKPTSPESRARCTRRGWEPNPLCKEKTCSKPSFKNAEITEIHQPDNYRHNDRVEFRCTYQPEVTFTVTCYNGETWYGQRACKEKPCPTIPEIANGEMLDPRQPPYNDRVNVQFRCIGEIDPFMVICKAGEWVTTRLCQITQGCGPPPPLENGDSVTPGTQFSNNDRVQYQCQNVYVMQGAPFKTCLNGQWTGEIRCLSKTKDCIKCVRRLHETARISQYEWTMLDGQHPDGST